MDARYPTAQCYITTSADGHHEFCNWPRPHAADMLFPEELPEPAFEKARLLHTTGISMMKEPRRLAVIAAAELAAKHGVIFCFDGSFPTGAGLEARFQVEEMLFRADVLKLNRQEALFWAQADLSGQQQEKELGGLLFDKYSPKVLLLTLAGRGSLVITAKNMVHCPPVPVTPVSEVGAGDGYIAGFLHTLLNDGLKAGDLTDLDQGFLYKAGMTGNIAGALATRSVSAYDGLPQRQELEDWMGKLPISSALD